MYQKGKEFLAAALLIKSKGSFTHVPTHLVCLAVELILKSLLLFRDYKKYKPLLPKRNAFGHDLVALALEWKTELNRNRINAQFLEELKLLHEYYINKGLRYGSLVDVFMAADSIKTKETLKQLQRIVLKTDKILISNASQLHL